jgi:hypothetical protein
VRYLRLYFERRRILRLLAEVERATTRPGRRFRSTAWH